MMQVPSPVQHCPHCGKYYFTRTVESKTASFESYDKGNLSYKEIKEALQQFEQQPLEQEEEINLRLLFIQTYNTTFQVEGQRCQIEPTEEERLLFSRQVKRLLEIWKTEPLLKAELLREAGYFDECLTILDHLQADETFKLKIAHRIRKFAENKSTVVFIIYGSRKDFI